MEDLAGDGSGRLSACAHPQRIKDPRFDPSKIPGQIGKAGLKSTFRNRWKMRGEIGATWPSGASRQYLLGLGRARRRPRGRDTERGLVGTRDTIPRMRL